MDKKDRLIEKLEELKIAVSNYFTLETDMKSGRAYPKENVKHIMRYEKDKIEKLLPEIAQLEQEIKDSEITDEKPIDKDWIFEIMDKTNAFAKQLIKDHFNRHNQ